MRGFALKFYTDEGNWDLIAGAMAGVPEEIVERQLGHFAQADPAYAEGVRNALG